MSEIDLRSGTEIKERTGWQELLLTHLKLYLQDCCSLALLEVLWDWHQIVTPSSKSFSVRRFCQLAERTFKHNIRLQPRFARPCDYCQLGAVTFSMLEPCNICFTSSSSCTPAIKETKSRENIWENTEWKTNEFNICSCFWCFSFREQAVMQHLFTLWRYLLSYGMVQKL